MERQLSFDLLTETRFEESASKDSVGTAWQYKMRQHYQQEESACPYWTGYDLRLSESVVKEIDYNNCGAEIEYRVPCNPPDEESEGENDGD